MGKKVDAILKELGYVDKWIAEGDAKAANAGQNAVVAFLRGRFKRVPKRIEESIRQKRDPIALESLASFAGTCESLEDFATALY